MNPTALRDELAGLAQEAGMAVRVLPGSPEVEPGLPIASGVCRLRGQVWVVLTAAESVEEHIETLAGALRTHAAGFLEARWLSPAVRERLERTA